MRISIFILERRRSGFWQTVAAPDKKRLDTIVGRRDRLGIVVIKAPFIVFFFASADLIRIRVNTYKCDDTMTTRLRPSSCCRRLEKPLPTAKACLSFGHCLDCVSELRGRISLEIPHLSRGNRTLAQLATSFSISELRPLQLWIQFSEKTRGVVHFQIGCMDFKTWKKFLEFFRFFSGFFWVYQDFMNKKRFKH